MQRLSLSETARRFDISKGYLSRRVHAGKPAKGYDLHHYAAFKDGKIDGFDLPEDMIPDEEPESSGKERKNRSRSSSRHGETGKRSGNGKRNVSSVSSGERENPGVEETMDGLMDGAVSGFGKKLAEGLIDSVRDLLEDADPSEAAMLGAGLRRTLIEIAPLLAFGTWVYTHRDSSDVVQLTGGLAAVAAVEFVLKGEESVLVQPWISNEGDPEGAPDSEDETTQKELSARSEAINDVAGQFLERATEGVAKDVPSGDGMPKSEEVFVQQGDSQDSHSD